MQDKKIDEYLCPICLQLLVDPIKLIKCKHMFCEYCLQELKDFTNEILTCPICRQKYGNNEPMIVDKELNQLIEQKYPQLYQQRKQQIQEKQMMLPDEIKIRIQYGNYHQLLNSNGKNQHQWKLFLRLDYYKDSDQQLLNHFILNELIESVTYQLHETFNPNVVTITQSPFLLKRIGWGVFNIPIIIKFKPKYQIPNIELEHYLSFMEDGQTNQSVSKLNITKIHQGQNEQKKQQQQQIKQQ